MAPTPTAHSPTFRAANPARPNAARRPARARSGRRSARTVQASSRPGTRDSWTVCAGGDPAGFGAVGAVGCAAGIRRFGSDGGEDFGQLDDETFGDAFAVHCHSARSDELASVAKVNFQLLILDVDNPDLLASRV